MPSSFVLGEHFEEFIRSMVASGRYDDASEVVRDGLRAREDRERDRVREEPELDVSLATIVENPGVGSSVEEERDRALDRLELTARRRALEASFEAALADVRAGNSYTPEEVRAHFDRRQEEMLRKRAAAE